MWLMLNDCFLSIVAKDCARGELLVRARRRGDIEKIFTGARVTESTTTDYAFRARVAMADVEAALIGEVRRITYANFKSSVTDTPLHDAYLKCWQAMATLQPTKPYSGLPARGNGSLWDLPKPPVLKRRRKRRSIKAGR